MLFWWLLTVTSLSGFKQAYYLPETEFVHWSRAHPVRNSITNNIDYHNGELSIFSHHSTTKYLSYAGIHKKPNSGADQPRCLDERLEKKNQVRNIRKDRMSLHTASDNYMVPIIINLMCCSCLYSFLLFHTFDLFTFILILLWGFVYLVIIWFISYSQLYVA